MLPEATLAQAGRLLETLRARGWRLVAAESCTGGLIAASLTAFAGSSDVFERGFVTYSNAAKIDLLGVPSGLIDAHGAVSAEVARAMAAGAIARSEAEIAIAVTGIAGPGGGSAQKPVGLVWFGLARQGCAASSCSMVFPGDRTAVRAAAVAFGLDLVAHQAASG
jgi:nicotinamide-nucleotide amidase